MMKTVSLANKCRDHGSLRMGNVMNQATILEMDSQSRLDDSVECDSAINASAESEFDYRPIPASAPISIGVGLLGLSSFITVAGAVFGVLGVGVGLLSLRKIKFADGEYGGRAVARLGIAVSMASSFAGVGFQLYEYRNELPEGYQRVHFVRDVADKQFVTRDGQRELHPDVAPLADQKIFIKGYMYQTQRMTGLRSFVLLKDNGECCFGGDPKPYDMMRVQMTGGRSVESIEGIVSVGGWLRTNVDAGPGEPVYILEADYFEKARTSF